MTEYHETALGASESIQPRHPSIVVIDPPATSAPLSWSAADNDPFCRCIDTLPSIAAQHCAAVIYDLLFDYEEQQIITSACRIPIALIAGVAGYSKAAIWRNLPICARAGLLVWKNAGGDLVTVQLTPPDLAHPPHPPAHTRPGAPPSTIPPSLRQLEADGYIALTLEANKQTITLLREVR